MATQEDRRAAQLWYEFHRSFQTGLGADPDESRADRRRRVKQLEKDPEKWFAYYFKKYYKAEAASFHKKATKRVIEHPEWFEVRAWSRELAKSVRTMMEVCYLVMTGRKKTIILTSNSKDNAERLLAPYRAFFESNERLIADYGPQANPGRWTESEFTTRGGAAFRAVGAQQSPRGSRNEELRTAMQGSREEHLAWLNAQLAALRGAVEKRGEGKGYVTSREADTVAKIAGAIHKIEGGSSLSMKVEIGKLFLVWLRANDPGKALEFLPLYDMFIKDSME